MAEPYSFDWFGDIPMFRTPEDIMERARRRNEAFREADVKQKADRALELKQARGYTMNNKTWPGLAKVVEKCGEVTQSAAKIMATFGENEYYDGSNLREQLEDEVADLSAALLFLVEQNDLDTDWILERQGEKLAKYHEWKESNQ